MDIYVIRDIRTKLYLPTPTGKNGRGGSHLEPTAYFRDARIMRSYRAAQSVLAMWLKGKFTAYRYSDPFDYECDEVIKIAPQNHRQKENMEIIKISIPLPD